ncbi:spore germination protein PE [Paenibacillus sp. UNCCL117]|uniref:spore germination protein GerPE n=1 Tax=unclassified Paenibacillus TaxID=185978 RepID=UPI0008905AE0|nr:MULTISPECIES: spore germination protein GerPE [unclassified Paenibacillus]SDC77312.1 spore germination protein PE [Paenibacillus sp. cl123]SFW25794.1 spore germination protein PE [Paenibacillus sp. UNCCL117]
MNVNRVRTSKVQAMKVYSIGYASALFIGDLQQFAPLTEALAIQREISRFRGDEGDLSAYPIFSVPIPQLQPIRVTRLSVNNVNPEICVSQVRILAVSTSSSFQVGSLGRMDAQSRIKNIREKLTGLVPK